MAEPYIRADSVDDLLRLSTEAVLKFGHPIAPTRGNARELSGMVLDLSNPRARLSRTETRGKLFSALGELCWYLAKSSDAAFISYYIRHYEASTEAGQVHGAYGPRLFDWEGHDQVATVLDLLRRNPESRRAVIQLFDRRDMLHTDADVPCTCTLQFLVRSSRLHLIVYMRSNDIYLGLPHDIFCFTMLQELISRAVGVELGRYTHMVGSLHLYERNFERARSFLGEGWQPTDQAMPPMPVGDPWRAVAQLVAVEKSLRSGTRETTRSSASLDSYWGDLARLLQIYRHWKDSDSDGIERLRLAMVSSVYDAFIDDKLRTPTEE